MNRLVAFTLTLGLLAVGCAKDPIGRPNRPKNDPVEIGGPGSGLGKADTFDWGNGCCGGSGTFNQDIAKDAVVTVGMIPKDKANVEIKLTCDKDVDIQLFDEDGTKVVQWPDGLLNQEGKQTREYNGLRITYSGYNGDGNNPGHESIKLEGALQNGFVMKAYGYAAGQARIDYSFQAKPGCVASGSGSFEKAIEKDAVVEVGTIIKELENVKVQLKSTVDIDIQLYDRGTKVVHWSEGLLKGPNKVSETYKEMKITWSGYNGDGTGKGNEYIEIEGKTTVELTLKVYGYEAGTATVDYSWGGDGGSSGGGGGPSKPFAQRLQDFKQKYPTQVVLATKQGKPAIFVNTKVCTTEAQATAFYEDLYKTVGTSTIMFWNPAGENYFHLAFAGGWNNENLDDRFYFKAMRLYSHLHLWDITAGNMDDECGYGDYDDQYVDEQTEPCFDSYQVERERAVALVKLDDAQLKSLNTYLEAIIDDFPGTLGPADYNGGTPPYFGGTKHNCTSWFTKWINKEVSSKFPTSANPASFLRSVTTGGYGGQLAPEFRALLVFNHASPPQDGATIDQDFPLDFGH
jgi:hypothetical protein